MLGRLEPALLTAIGSLCFPRRVHRIRCVAFRDAASRGPPMWGHAAKFSSVSGGDSPKKKSADRQLDGTNEDDGSDEPSQRSPESDALQDDPSDAGPRCVSVQSLASLEEPENEPDADSDTNDPDEAPSFGLVKPGIPPTPSTLFSVPVSRRPIFPGFYKTIAVADTSIAKTLTERFKKGKNLIGIFLGKSDALSAQIVGDEQTPGSSPAGPDGIAETEQVVPDDQNPETSCGSSSHADAKPGSSDRINALSEIHPIGVLAQVVNVFNVAGQGATAIVFPHRRIKATALLRQNLLSAVTLSDERFDPKDRVLRAISQEIFGVLAEIAKLNSFFREHIAHHNVSAGVFEDPSRLADFCAVLASGEPEEMQSILSTTNIKERLRKALVLLKKELLSAELQRTISKQVEQSINKKQREYFLHEQLKSIKKELGLELDTKEKLLAHFRSKAESIHFPPDVQLVFEEEMAKLNVLEQSGSEFNVVRNYLDWLVSVPFGIVSKEEYDPLKVMQQLDADHYGLEDVKARICEFVAVGKLKGCLRGKILLLSGPPGVGKTSIGHSIAQALGREFFRFSVGGLSDVSEIKGHRRTYVGAMPGKIVQALKKTKTMNPLILIDEIDKLSKSHTGDPASALLELLDPSQNNSFLDHYLDVPLDLSQVLFIATANQLDTIPQPLMDRMEVVQLSGYLQSEKVAIGERYLLPKSLLEMGLVHESRPGIPGDSVEAPKTSVAGPLVEVEEGIVSEIVNGWCRDSGVRDLKRAIDRMLRKTALKIVKEQPAVEGQLVDSAQSPSATPQSIPNEQAKTDEAKISTHLTTNPLKIKKSDLVEVLGPRIYQKERLYEHTPPGVVMGLAWTSNGGSVLYIETADSSVGKPSRDQSQTQQNDSGNASPSRLILTGQLGKVMEESSTIAYTFAKSFLAQKFSENTFLNRTLHLHVPQGATPKDGPSAGIAMTSALISLGLHKPVPHIAMTGEISLTGKVLAVGGIREKLVAASRAQVDGVILPEMNRGDYDELPQFLKNTVKVFFVTEYSQVYDILFGEMKQ